MTSGKAIALLIALFLAGAISGGFVGYNIATRRAVQPVAALPDHPPKQPPNGMNPPRPNGWRPFEGTRERLTRELSLSDEQLVKIDPIITAFDAQLKSMSEQNFNHLATAVSNRNEQIKQYLTPDQVQKLEERSKRMGRPGGPRDHGREEDSRDRHTPEPTKQ